MSRIRTIKPEFWSSEQVMECSPIARLLFIGIWTFCDDEGRHSYSPKTLLARVFPCCPSITVETVEEMLVELEAVGLIHSYVVDGASYFHVTGWHHQKIDRPQPPKYPSPSDGQKREHSKKFVEYSANGRALREGKGGEGKGIDQPQATPSVGDAKPASEPVPEKPGKQPTTPRGIRLPADWTPDQKALDYARRKGLSEARITDEAERFVDHWIAKNGPDAIKLDWDAAWRTWVRNAIEYRSANIRGSPARKPTMGDIARGNFGARFGDERGNDDKAEPSPNAAGPARPGFVGLLPFEDREVGGGKVIDLQVAGAKR